MKDRKRKVSGKKRWKNKRKSIRTSEIQGHIFDSAFKTIISIPFLFINLINEMFNESISASQEVIFLKEELLSPVSMTKKICDFHALVCGKSTSYYHLECETHFDDGNLLKMSNYDIRIAMEHYSGSDYTLHVRMPKSGILYLNDNPIKEKELKFRINDDENEYVHPIKIVKLANYTVKQLLEKKLYSLLPFFLLYISHFSIR